MKEEFLKTYQVPEIKEVDIVETIVNGKKIISRFPVEKRENNLIKQMFMIIKYHFPILFLFQIILTIILLFALINLIAVENDIQMQNETIPYLDLSIILIIGSVLFSMITGIELIRNQIYDMLECEKACYIRPEKMIAFKLCLLSVSTVVLISFLSIFLKIYNSDVSLIILLVIGIFPYMVITTMIVLLIDHLRSLQSVLSVYVGMTMLFIITIYLRIDNIIAYLNSYAILTLFILFVICVFMNAYKLNRNH